MNIFDEFKKTSKKAWLAKVDKDLKEKSASDYLVDLCGEIKINPFFHLEDKIEINVPKIKGNNTWLINEEINEAENENLNSSILKALEGGANSISIKINKIWNIEDFKNTFKGIYLNYIFIHFEFEIEVKEVENFFIIFKKYLLEIGLKSTDVAGSVNSKKAKIISKNLGDFENLKYNTISSKKSTEIILQIADLLIDAENILAVSTDKNEQSSLSKSIVFEINNSNSFYLNIAKIRALKILWATVLDSYQIEFNIFIKAYINTEKESNENTSIIAATSQAISAIIGGVEILAIKPFRHNKTKYGNGFSKRIARNIHNILSVESLFSAVNDPMNGSYFMDNLTKNICESVWAKFQLKLYKS